MELIGIIYISSFFGGLFYILFNKNNCGHQHTKKIKFNNNIKKIKYTKYVNKNDLWYSIYDFKKFYDDVNNFESDL